METYYKSLHVAMTGSVDLTGFIVVVWHYFWCLEACWKKQIVACVIFADITHLKYYTSTWIRKKNVFLQSFIESKYQQLERQLTNRKGVVDPPAQESPNVIIIIRSGSI